MIITYLGAEFFKVQFGDITLAFNPISKDSGLISGPHAHLKPSRFGADIVLVSTYHEDMNGVNEVTYGDKKPFVVNGPGEYEVKDVFIKGLPSQTGYGMVGMAAKKSESASAALATGAPNVASPLVNTIYTVSLENMNICFLGALNNAELADETIEAIDGIDILFVPIGGNGVLDPAKAYKLAVSLEPKIIIPMHYGDMSGGKSGSSSSGSDTGTGTSVGTSAKDALKIFLKEAGENPAPVAKLTLKKKDLEGKEGDVVVLEAGGE